MAYTDESGWNPTKSAYGTPVGGLTDKQKDMSTARNPMNNNAQNTALPQQEAKEDWKPTKPKLPQQADTARNEQVQADVKQLQSKIGSSAYQVQGLVNKFLKEGQATAQVKTSMEQVFDPVTKKYLIKNAKPEDYDVTGAVQEKMGQLGAIKQAAAPFYSIDPATGKYKVKTLEESIKGMENYTALDPQRKGRVDELIGVAGLINEYENRGQGGSAEAAALRQQLQQMDKTGVVSGMYKAVQDYQKFAGTGVEGSEGMQWYGDAGDEGLGLSRIMEMTNKDLEAELRKALTTGSGVFGGEYELGLKRGIDTESAEAQQAAEQETEYRNQLMEASQGFFADKKSTLMQRSGDIQKAFAAAAPAIIAEMGDDPAGIAARDFFTKLSTTDADSFGQLISDLLYNPNSGLGTAQRKALRDMLGDLTEGGTGDGQIEDWINQLSTQGYVEDESGKKIDISAEDKYALLTELQSNDPDKNAKNERMKAIVDRVMHTNNIGNQLDGAMKVAMTEGNLAKAIAGFGSAIAQSLKTFATSKTEDAVRTSLGISDADWAGMDATKKAQAISDALAGNPDLTMKSVRDAAQVQQEAFHVAAEQMREKIAGADASLKTKIDAITKARDNIVNSGGNIIQAVRGFLSDGLVRTSQEATKKYQDYFAKYTEQYKALGYKPAQLQEAAGSLARRDALLNLREKRPDIWKNIYKGTDIENYLNLAPGAAVDWALTREQQGGMNTTQLFSDLMTNSNNSLQTIINGVPEMLQAQEKYNAILADANQELAKATGMQGGSKEKLAVLDKMEASLKGKLFSPDQIAQMALNIGRSIEQNGVNTTGQNFLNMEQGYAPASKDSIAGMIAGGYDEATTPLQTQFNMGEPVNVGAGIGAGKQGVSETDLNSKMTKDTATQAAAKEKQFVSDGRDAYLAWKKQNIDKNAPDYETNKNNFINNFAKKAVDYLGDFFTSDAAKAEAALRQALKDTEPGQTLGEEGVQYKPGTGQPYPNTPADYNTPGGSQVQYKPADNRSPADMQYNIAAQAYDADPSASNRVKLAQASLKVDWLTPAQKADILAFLNGSSKPTSTPNKSGPSSNNAGASAGGQVSGRKSKT